MVGTVCRDFRDLVGMAGDRVDMAEIDGSSVDVL